MASSTLYKEAFSEAANMARLLGKGGAGLVGFGVAELFDGDMRSKLAVPFSNLITDAGDLYYASKAIESISPANASSPTAAVVMKLGTGSSAPTKAGATATLGAYITGSNQVFDATYPQTANLGTTLGVNAVYKVTWGAGSATNAAITEAIIANTNADATATIANTYSRVIFTAVNKGSSDTLAITWNHKFLGS